MPMTPIEIIKLLEKSGFHFVRANGSHRFYRNPETNKTTTVPFHKNQLKKGTEQNIFKQVGLK